MRSWCLWLWLTSAFMSEPRGQLNQFNWCSKIHRLWFTIIEYYNDLVEILKCVDLKLKLTTNFNPNNRKLRRPLILRNLVNKILVIHQRTIHKRIIPDNLQPSIISSMVKLALLLRHPIPLGNSFETDQNNLPKNKYINK